MDEEVALHGHLHPTHDDETVMDGPPGTTTLKHRFPSGMTNKRGCSKRRFPSGMTNTLDSIGAEEVAAQSADGAFEGVEGEQRPQQGQNEDDD